MALSNMQLLGRKRNKNVLYIGVFEVDYEPKSQLVLPNMQLPANNDSNYRTRVMDFLKEELGSDYNSGVPPFHLVDLILENIFDHGSQNCKVIIGKRGENTVVEIFEKYGGFDLRKLPNGKGGWGYNQMKRDDWVVSHSPDGKKTFLQSP